MFTATAVLALVEERGLDLDGRLGDSGLEVPAHWREIRLRQLLAHASGLPEGLERPDVRAWIREERSLPELLASFVDRELAFAPGTHNAYGNSSLSVLAAWLEHVAGKSYAACLEELVLTPAGLASTPQRRSWVVLLTNRGPEEAHRPGRLALQMLELLFDG